MMRNPHVLVVDDDGDQRAVLAHLVRAEGWTVSEAASGEEALRLVADEDPDLVMLDVAMPRQSGFSVCEQLVRAREGARLPHIIFVTGQSDLRDSVRGLELGAVDYVTKPFLAEDLMARARVAVRLKSQLDALADDAARDALTGLWNRRQLATRGRELVAVARRYELGLSCLMVDVDHFKRINEHFGHAVGDLVLQKVADRLRAQVRESDLLFRYGGEEFLVLAPHTDAVQALNLAERLRVAVAESALPVGTGVRASVSVGLATWGTGETIGSLVHRADLALFEGKRRGRNRVVPWSGDLAEGTGRGAAWHEPGESAAAN